LKQQSIRLTATTLDLKKEIPRKERILEKTHTRMKKEENENKKKIKENIMEFQHHWTQRCTRVQNSYARWGIQEKIKERITKQHENRKKRKIGKEHK
jgi:hypothetical protein